MIRVLIALLVLPLPAEADAWAAVKRLCLEPLEAAVAISTNDFEIVSETTTSVRATMVLEGVLIHVDTRKSTFQQQSCRAYPQTRAAERELFDGYTAWSMRAVAEGRYVFSEGSLQLYDEIADAIGPYPGFYSTDFREPRLRVNFRKGMRPYSLNIDETRLES